MATHSVTVSMFFQIPQEKFVSISLFFSCCKTTCPRAYTEGHQISYLKVSSKLKLLSFKPKCSGRNIILWINTERVHLSANFDSYFEAKTSELIWVVVFHNRMMTIILFRRKRTNCFILLKNPIFLVWFIVSQVPFRKIQK